MAVTTTQNPKLASSRQQASDPAIDVTTVAATTEYILATVGRGFHCNTDGNFVVDMLGGIDGKTAATNVTFVVKAGQFYPYCITKVYNTTTATGQVLH